MLYAFNTEVPCLYSCMCTSSVICLLTGKPIQLYSYNMHVYEAIKSNKYSYIVSAPAIAMVS